MLLPAITLDKKEISDIKVLNKEWLVTNGLGGYASSTVLGINTRKYHGLLVAALNPPGNRTVCLSKLDEDIIVQEKKIRLGANEFHDGFFPEGHRFLYQFQITPFPKFAYTSNKIRIEKTIFMPNKKNVTIALYTFLNEHDSNVKARIFPILTSRHFHSVVDSDINPLNLHENHNTRSVEVQSEKPKATIIVNASEGEFVPKRNLIRHLFYREEANRGESSYDDCIQPGYFEKTVPHGSSQFAIVSSAYENEKECKEELKSVGTDTAQLIRLLSKETNRKTRKFQSIKQVQVQSPSRDWLNWILLAADSFIVHDKNDSTSIIAGYHWFESWGRDTFISLPGLLLVTGRFDEAEQILSRFAKYIKQGLIPNLIADNSEEPVYNTVDGTLWYINSVLQYLKYSGSFQFVEKNIWPILQEIIESHIRGTQFGIHVEDDGLLAHGPRLTWMDAEVAGVPITPRVGKAVEIQALWHNALKIVELLAKKFGNQNLAVQCSQLATEAKQNFNRKFWNNEKNCLLDVVGPHSSDEALRPNQIIAISLDFPVLQQDKNEIVVNTVQSNLLTDNGLRTLTPNDPHYQGIYAGNRTLRDRAYHNGTVWPWMLGPFVTAFLKAKGAESSNREQAFHNFLLPLFSKQITQAGLGTISEVFDGDPPHAPKGCISQAWSIAEPLRAYIEDILQVRPVYEKQILQH